MTMTESDSMIFELKCGAKVSWKKNDIFQGYHIEVVDNDPLTETETGTRTRPWCGNPYNLMTKEEYETIISKRPKASQIPCNLDSMLYNKIIEKKNLSDDIIDNIYADCWGIFTTTSDRKEIIKVYYDLRNSERKTWRTTLSVTEYHEKVQEVSRERYRLGENPEDLINDIEQGHTVILVFGGDELIETYYYKIGELYVRSTVDHTMKW